MASLTTAFRCKSHGVHSGIQKWSVSVLVKILSEQHYEVYICLGQMNAYQVEL